MSRSRSIPFKGLAAASSKASLIKARVKKTNSKCEVLLRAKLWERGLRYRKNVNSLPGCPDIVFLRRRIVIFCDGDFWHGRNWRHQKEKLRAGHNSDYWIAKIESNMTRDKKISMALREAGWEVIRVWEADILLDCDSIVARLQRLLQQ